MEQDGSRLSRLNLGRGGGGAVVSEGNLKKGGWSKSNGNRRRSRRNRGKRDGSFGSAINVIERLGGASNLKIHWRVNPRRIRDNSAGKSSRAPAGEREEKEDEREGVSLRLRRI